MPTSETQFDGTVLLRLACPVCFGSLQAEPAEKHVRCVHCQRAYPLIGGIPVLIPERAILSN